MRLRACFALLLFLSACTTPPQAQESQRPETQGSPISSDRAHCSDDPYSRPSSILAFLPAAPQQAFHPSYTLHLPTALNTAPIRLMLSGAGGMQRLFARPTDGTKESQRLSDSAA